MPIADMKNLKRLQRIDETELVKYQDHYSEPRFWNKMKRFAAKLGGEVCYYLLVLYYALQSSETTLRNKALILGALGYFILPVDLIPDFIPALGITDDIAAITIAFKAIIDSVTPEVKARAAAKKLEWFR